MPELAAIYALEIPWVAVAGVVAAVAVGVILFLVLWNRR